MATTLGTSDKTSVGRQDVLSAHAKVTYGASGDTAATGTVVVMAIPAGAIVVGGYLNVTTAMPANADIHVGDGGVANRYTNDVDGAATGVTALTLTGYKYTTNDTIDILVDTAAPTAGAVELIVNYVVEGRAAFAQP
jgi:hypothetical protein